MGAGSPPQDRGAGALRDGGWGQKSRAPLSYSTPSRAILFVRLPIFIFLRR